MGSTYLWCPMWIEWMHRHWENSKNSKWGQCYNHSCVGHATRFSKDNWASMYFKNIWTSWNWPSYSRECWQYRLPWHLVVDMSSMTVPKAKSASWYYRLWLWRPCWTRLWITSSAPTDYENSQAPGSNIQNTVITGHSSHHKIDGPLWSTSWKYWSHLDIWPCGRRRLIQSY